MSEELIYRDVRKAETFIHPFPDASEVFDDPLAKHAEYLLPLVSVDLASIYPDLEGRIHFVAPMEPEDGCIGEETEDYHSYYNRENCFAFKVGDDGRYTFLGDFRYFAFTKERDEDPEDESGMIEEWEEIYKTERGHYDESKKYFQEHGCMAEGQDVLLEQLGGQGWYAMGNSWNFDDMPVHEITGMDEDGDPATEELPVTEDGKVFRNIGYLSLGNYISIPAELILFYEPENRIALVTFSWS